MTKNYYCLIALICFLTGSVNAQDTYTRNRSADVQHYIFSVSLNDHNNQIVGESLITVNLKNTTDTFTLDLIGKSGSFGMELTGVFEGNNKADYEYNDNKILIHPSPETDMVRTYKVQYHGIPEKGLVIDTTKYGQRSFFGDNWPDLARYWLPSVDHPYDKATVEFRVTAPEYYDVVATGKKVEESNLGNGYKLTSYKEPAQVATKVITIGVSKFASKVLGYVDDIEVTAWVYPENRLEGFSDFDESTKILQYYINHIGTYSYAKLANMQAKTAWGGLENAGTIAYSEKSITGKNEIQGLMAHEIAHQWFGDSATENNWNHVWLSEGFATYFTILYQESVEGNEKRKEELAKDREEVIEYYHKNPSPVVDNTIKDPRKVLNKNSYQKGGWVLNMLRHKLGNEVFWKGIQVYYNTYKDSNVMTVDFQKVMEQVSGEDLEDFFEQWIFTKGYPEIKWDWKYKKGKVIISMEQVQKHHVFKFPIEFGLLIGDQLTVKSAEVYKRSESFEFDAESKPVSVVIDPDFWLLYEEK